MKRIISLTVMFCAIAASALAAAPETALKALTLGNEKFAMEQTLKAGPMAIVIADPAITQAPEALFSLSESQVTVIRTEAAFGSETSAALQAKDLVAPLVLVLGLDEESVWAVYANALQASPELIHAVLKGQVSAVGATVDASTGTVKILGAHPNLQTLVGQYLLGVAPEKAAAVTPETGDQGAPGAPAAEPAASENHDAPAEAAHEAPKAEGEAQASGGGSGVMLVILFVAALVGAVIFMDKTVLKS